MTRVRRIPLASAVLAIALPFTTAFLPDQFTHIQAVHAQQQAFQAHTGAVAAESITPAAVGNQVTIQGTIARVVPSTGERVPHQLIIVDRDPNPVMAIYWPDTEGLIHGDKGIPTPGLKISVTGQVSDYRGALQIRVRNNEQIRIEGYGRAVGRPEGYPQNLQTGLAAPAIPAPQDDGYYLVSDLPALMPFLMQKVSMKGRVATFRTPWSERAPHAIEMNEGPHNLQIVFWPPEGAALPPVTEPGTPLFVTGQLQEYRGQIQLQVDDLANLSASPLPPERLARLEARAPATSVQDGWPGRGTASPPPTERVELTEGTALKLRDIGPQHIGNRIRVEGEIRSIAAVEDGMALLIHDSEGFLRVNLPADYDQPVLPGRQVSILGTVMKHPQRTAMELKLERTADLTIKP